MATQEKLMKASTEQITYIIERITAYGNICYKRAKSDRTARMMFIEDAKYNLQCAENFLEHQDLARVIQDLICQDTAPREEVLSMIVDTAVGQELGLTWDFINCHA